VPTSPTPAPIPVRFLRPFGFTDDYGDKWRFGAGDIIRNPFVLGLIEGRGAPTIPLED
jgi:hypothetical protein